MARSMVSGPPSPVACYQGQGTEFRAPATVLDSGDSTPAARADNVIVVNLFDDPDGSFVVLVNDEDQHSLWPADLPAPAGWSGVHGPDTRQACLDYVEKNWTDIRPRSARHDTVPAR